MNTLRTRFLVGIGSAILIFSPGNFCALMPTPQPTATPTATPRSTATLTPVVAAVAPSPTASPTASPTQTLTPTPTATSQPPTVTPTFTLTPTETVAPPTATPQAVEPAPAAAESGAVDAPQPLSPQDGMVFSDMADDIQIWLEWSAITPALAADEYYRVTLTYQVYGQTWTDTANTTDTRWLVNEHSYLRGLATDGLYRWTVTLVKQTGLNASGEAIETELSPPGPQRAFVWQVVQPPADSSGSDDDDDNDNREDNGGSNTGGGLPGYP